MGSVTFVVEATSGERGDAWMLEIAEERPALESFGRNGFVMPAGAQVTFLKLVPLAGG